MRKLENIDKLYDSIIEELKKLKDSSRDEIVLKYSRLLSKIIILKNQIEDIERRKTDLVKEFENVISNLTDKDQEKVESLIVPLSTETSSRELAKLKRKEFLNNLERKGVRLEQFKGVIYKNINNSGLVGIAYSGEKYQSWFLGLPIENYKVIVLLCSAEDNKMHNIILPEDFCSMYVDHLSRSHGQLKFSVRQGKNDFILYTKLGNVSIKQYVNVYSPFLK
jgi:hypothetical protein